MKLNKVASCAAVTVASIGLASCGGGGGGGGGDGGTQNPPAPAPTYTVGGTVTGLTGSGLILSNNGTDTRSIVANGAFTFSLTLANGAAYFVSVANPPANQNCTVVNGMGSIATANVSSVAVNCAPRTFVVGGTVSGLQGTGLTLSNNFGEEVVINAAGSFAFPTPLTNGQSYKISITLPPANPMQTCTLSNESGTVSTASITNVVVECSTYHTRFAFSTNQLDGTVGVYAMDDATGQLRPRTIAKAGTQPFTLAGERSRRFLYVMNQSSSNITGFDIEPNTAVLTEKPSSPYPTGVTPFGFFSNPSGSAFYVPSSTSDNVTSYSINSTTGDLDLIPGSPYPGYSMSIVQDPDGRFSYRLLSTGEIVIAAVNPVSGGLVEIAKVPTLGVPRSIGITRSGKFLYAFSATEGVYGFSIHPTTGLLTALPGFPFAATAEPLYSGMHTSGRFLYLRSLAARSLSLVAINPTTGALTYAPGSPYLTGVLNPIHSPHPSGRFDYVSDLSSTVYSFAINPNTGAVTPLPGSPMTVSIASFAYIEPSGKFLYLTSGATLHRVIIYSIDQATGVLTQAGPPITLARHMSALLLSSFTTGIAFKSDFAYVPNFSDHTVSTFAIDQATGKMTAVGSPLATGMFPMNLTMDLRARFLYVANTSSDTISGFRIGSTGALTSMGSPFATGTVPDAMAIEPSGRFAYVADAGTTDDIRSYRIDQATGALNSFGTPVPLVAGSDSVSLVIHPNGLFMYSVNPGVDTITSFTINQTSGDLTASPTSVATASKPIALKIDPTGRFAYVTHANSSAVNIYAIDPSSGALALTGVPATAGVESRAIDIDPTGKFVFVASYGTDQVFSFSINPSSGALTAINAPLATDAHPMGLKVDYSGDYLYVTSEGAATVKSYSINKTTGALTLIPGSSVATGALPATMAISTRTY